jgi:diguanylate cyclase (GGDEF)-like protein
MRASAKALRLLPICVIGLVTMLWPPAPATATSLAVKTPPILAKGKGPPQDATKPKGKDKADAKAHDKAVDKGHDKASDKGHPKAHRVGNDVVGLGVEVKESKDGSPSSATVVTPVGPVATVQLPATPSPATATPETAPGAPTGSSESETTNQAVAPPARRTKARSKREQGGARASSTPRALSSPLGAAAFAPLDRGGNTSNRTAGRRQPKRSGTARRSVVERIVDRVPAAYRLGLLAAIAVAGGFALATIRQRRRARRAEAEALVDPLTGLANRRAFDRRLAEEWKRAERYGRPLGLVMLDLDGFKRLNDTRGHKEGDRVLREAASITADRLREIDLAARLGGDEFAAICPETPTEGLHSLAHSLERCLSPLPVGASIGFASRETEDESPLDMLERADAAMYRTKKAHSNGDRVTLSR